MNREEILSLLKAHRPNLAERYGVTYLALFGSFSRDQATDDCGVDLLVGLDGPAMSRAYFGEQFYIEDRLGRRGELVTEKALRKVALHVSSVIGGAFGRVYDRAKGRV